MMFIQIYYILGYTQYYSLSFAYNSIIYTKHSQTSSFFFIDFFITFNAFLSSANPLLLKWTFFYFIPLYNKRELILLEKSSNLFALMNIFFKKNMSLYISLWHQKSNFISSSKAFSCHTLWDYFFTSKHKISYFCSHKMAHNH
jgi:hypothetical protein